MTEYAIRHDMPRQERETMYEAMKIGGLFDCSSAIAAKLARCEAMAREQAHAPALWTTAIDHRILCGIQERLVLADRTNRALSEWYRSLNA